MSSTSFPQSPAVNPPLLSISMSSACRSGGSPLLRPMLSGSVLNATTTIISLGLGWLVSPPIQARFLRTCFYLTTHHVVGCTVIIAVVSTITFTLIVYLSSFLTAACLGLFGQGASEDSRFFSYYFSPMDTFKDLVSSTLSILNDEFGIIDRHEGFHQRSNNHPAKLSTEPDTLIVRLVKKFLLGLPLVGIGSLIQMILSMPILGPVHWIARYRSARGRRASSRDITAIIVLGLMVIGAIRFIYQSLEATILLNTENLPFP